MNSGFREGGLTQPAFNRGLARGEGGFEHQQAWRAEEKIDEAIHVSLAREFLDSPYPHADRLTDHAYEAQKRALQIELLKLQDWLKTSRQRLIILFEGRDAAGKGGTIKRFTENLNPRSARVVCAVAWRSRRSTWMSPSSASNRITPACPSRCWQQASPLTR